MKMFVVNRKIVLSILLMLVLLFSVQSLGYSQAVCKVGDIIQPGEYCTYFGAGDVTFSVHNNGSTTFSARGVTFHTGRGARINARNVNGFTLVATGRADGKWVIEDLGGAVAPPTIDVLVADPEAPPIYWTDTGTDKIQRANLDGTNTENLVTTLGRGIALDMSGSKMYWTDGDKIQRANLDGSNVQTLVNTVDTSWGVALDVVGGKIYWTIGPISEASQGKIQRANLDGTNVETLVTGILDTPEYITLDVPGGKMYWTFSEPDRSEIQRANLDGTNVETIIPSAHLGFPGGIALDVGSGKLYWTDWSLNQIRRANLDGSNIQTLVNMGVDSAFSGDTALDFAMFLDMSVPWDLALDVANGKMYWTMYPIRNKPGKGKIQRANLDGTNVETLITGLNSPDYIAMGIRDPAALVISAGNNQNGTPNTQLTVPLVVQVLDIDDNGVANVRVDFRVSTGQGRLSSRPSGRPVYVPTNSQGLAEVSFTPKSAGTHTIQASVLGLDPVEFTVNAGPPQAKLIKVSGDTQSGNPGTRLANPFVVEVQDKDDAPMEGVSVTFSVTAGGGKLSATTVTTGKNGRAQTFLTLGATRAVNRVQASVSGINTPVTFSTSIEATVLIAAANRPPMYWIDPEAGTLHRLVGAKVENLIPSVQNATGLTVDATTGKLYWTEKTGDRTGRIRRANLDGSNVQLVKNLTSVPLHLTLDAANGKLYLINSWNKIQSLNVDGTAFKPNLVTGLMGPKGFAVDPTHSKVYYIEQTGQRTGRIRSANLDGTDVAVVKTLTSVPGGIAIDTVNDKLYITNAYGKVQRMNLDGKNYQPNLITGLTAPMNVAVDAVGGKVYWTESGSLRRADLTGENVQDVLTGSGPIASLVLGTMPVANGAPAAPAAVANSSPKNALLANYPNPCNPETWIPYQLSESAEVSLTIYDIQGHVVRALDLGHQRAGLYQSRSRAVYWDGRNAFGEPVASGLYFYTLTAGDFSATRKMLIRK